MCVTQCRCLCFQNTNASGHITLVESTPGNFEVVGNGPIAVGGKLLATTSVIGKIKPGNVITVTSPSNMSNVSATSTNSPKPATVSQNKPSAANSHSKKISLFSDDSE